MDYEDGEEVEVPKEEPKEEPGKRFFLAHLNTYTGLALLKELKNAHLVKDPEAAHTFYGTLKKDEKNYVGQICPEGVSGLYEMERTKEFREAILESDVIIYDLQTNAFEEIDYVIKALKTSDLNNQKQLILLSSVLTWMNTPPKIQIEGDELPEGEAEEEEEPEEEVPEEEEQQEEPQLDANGDPLPKKKVLYFKESDYHLRIPDQEYNDWKTLETQAMSSVKTQPNLIVNVLCTGLRYGNGEDKLFGFFKFAWLQSPSCFQYFQKGDNLIPTIHVIDLARIVRRVVKDKIIKPYIFAVDRTPKPTAKRLMKAISEGVGSGAIESTVWPFEYQYEFQEIKKLIKINLKMKTSDVFKDGEPPEDAEDPEEEAKKLKFPWHCEKGLIANIRMINNEFNEFNKLNPVKIFISGPPASGKSYYANKISAYYNIPLIAVKQLVDKALEMAKVEEGATELHEEIKAKIEELKDAKVAEIEESRPEDAEPEEIDRDKLEVRLPDELLFKLLKKRLTDNDCRNRGYILDGYPRCFKHAQEIFLIRPKKFVDGEEVEEDEPDLEEGEEKSYEGYIPNPDIFPKSFILLQGDDNFLIDRVKNLPQISIEGTHYVYEAMQRRLKQYRNWNDSQIAEPSLESFFKEQGMQTFRQDCKVNEDIVVNALKIYIERFEKPNNFLDQDSYSEQNQRGNFTNQNYYKQQDENTKIQREEQVEKELRKQKEQYTKQRLDQIKEMERDLLDTKSQPIRQYLMDNLVQILTDGLIEVCKKTPEDPVDYLAEYLFRRSLDVPYPDPSAY